MRTVRREELGRWDGYYLAIAKAVAGGSKDPSTRVGAVVVGAHNRIVGTGFNGLPPGLEDTPERLNDRPTKYEMTIHAEVNALMQAGSACIGGTLYVSGLPPCAGCGIVTVSTGVKRVVVDISNVTTGNPETRSRWLAFAHTTAPWYDEAGIEFLLAD